MKHWEIGLREPSAEICEKLGALATTPDLADYWAECAGLPPYSGNVLQYLPSPPARDATVPPTDAQTRMELHVGLDIILDRAPETFRDKMAQEITRGAGQFGNSPVAGPAGRLPTPQEKRRMRLLAKILGSGNPESIEAVTQNLEVFARYVEAAGPKPAPPSEGRPELPGAPATAPPRRLKP